MRPIKVKDNQTLFDISIQEYGMTIYAVVIALINDLSITSELTAGQELLIPEGLTIDEKVLKYYEENNVIPASAELTEDMKLLIGDEYGDDDNQSPPIIPYDPTFSEQF